MSSPGLATTFLILSTPRSGTMMVTDALDEHECVSMFNLYASNPDNPKKYHHNWRWWQDQKDPAVTHRGTTMHRVGDGWIKSLSPVAPSQFWGMLQRQHVRWICIHRENLLRQFLSKKVGVILGDYGVHKPRPRDPGPVRIPITELIEYIQDTLDLQERIDQHFPERITVAYEQLCDDWPGQFRRIQMYLGLAPKDIRPVTLQQETRLLRVAVENYDEIAHCLEGRGRGSWLD